MGAGKKIFLGAISVYFSVMLLALHSSQLLFFSKDNGDGKLNKNEYTLDIANASNPVPRIGDCQMPIDKSTLIHNGSTYELEE